MAHSIVLGMLYSTQCNELVKIVCDLWQKIFDHDIEVNLDWMYLGIWNRYSSANVRVSMKNVYSEFPAILNGICSVLKLGMSIYPNNTNRIYLNSYHEKSQFYAEYLCTDTKLSSLRSGRVILVVPIHCTVFHVDFTCTCGYVLPALFLFIRHLNREIDKTFFDMYKSYFVHYPYFERNSGVNMAIWK